MDGAADRNGIFRRALLVLLLLLLATEAAVRALAPRLWSDPQRVESVSASLQRDRWEALKAGGPALAFFGDSVLYGSALRERGDAAWRDHTPAACLRGILAGRGRRLISYGADGLYPMDLEALVAGSMALSPTALVIELNYRMLCQEAGNSATALSRPYLGGWLPAAAQAAIALRPDPADGLRRAWATYRYMELASTLVWQPSLKERLAMTAASFFPPADESGTADIKDALLDLKIRPYYQAPARAPGHLGWDSLDRLARALQASGKPCLVFLTPQNLPRVSGLLDRRAWAANRSELSRIFAVPGIRYRDWGERMPAQRFLDHCHLDLEGDQALAGWIAAELPHEP